ncbi:MAG: DUF3078 domain-containing protein [Bacteroidaceae bacterium]|nr:DUF3078 domain-containing protein [Bacteroidaceae bacterium]
MKRFIIVSAFLMAMPCAQAKVVMEVVTTTDSIKLDSLITELGTVLNQYSDSLTLLVEKRNQVAKGKKAKSPSPYYFRLFAPGTVYSSALQQTMGIGGDDQSAPVRPLRGLGSTEDEQLTRDESINNMLNVAYVTHPNLFTTTQYSLQNVGKLRSDLSKQKIKEEVRLADRVESEDVGLDIDIVQPIATRPNFWKIKGNGSLQFTQTYFSANWYQGGEKNYAMLGMLAIEANYDNKQKIQWDNKFEAQLGFQTSQSDDYHKFRATNNLLRFTTKFGFKASAHWNYTAQVQLQTQPYPTYPNNSQDRVSAFLAPFYSRISVGMDYKLKKERFNSSVYISPISHNITYVRPDELVTRYGIDEGKHAKHDFGPSININFTWEIVKNVKWTNRTYWFSNMKYTLIECENKINFTINKYLSTNLFFYPRFDDTRYYNLKKNDDGTLQDDSARETHWMFKEWLSLGLSYDF